MTHNSVSGMAEDKLKQQWRQKFPCRSRLQSFWLKGKVTDCKVLEISFVYDPATARWLVQKPFTPLIWRRLPVPHILKKTATQKDTNTSWMYPLLPLCCSFISRVFYPLLAQNVKSNTKQRQKIKNNCSWRHFDFPFFPPPLLPSHLWNRRISS